MVGDPKLTVEQLSSFSTADLLFALKSRVLNDAERSQLLAILQPGEVTLEQRVLTASTDVELQASESVEYRPTQSMALLLKLRNLFQQKINKEDREVTFLRWSDEGSDRQCPEGSGCGNQGFLESIVEVANEGIDDKTKQITDDMAITWINRFQSEYPGVLRFETIRGHVGTHCGIIEDYIDNAAEYKHGKESANYGSSAVREEGNAIKETQVSSLLRLQILAVAPKTK